MPTAGNSYIVRLSKAHLEWGVHRHTFTRPGLIYGEGYIRIPRDYAIAFNILMSNHPTANILYNCVSYDRQYEGILKAQGNSGAGDIFAKQFSEYGNLKAIGSWYCAVGAVVGNYVKVMFTSPSDMIIEHSCKPNNFHI